MAGVQIATTSGGSQTLDDAAVGALSSGLQGKLIQQDDATYDETRAIWNAMIDKRPGLIVQCASASDIVTAVKFAREHDLLVTVRGAGHNIAGKAVCDGGLMIDLSQMKGVRVDAGAKRAFVEPGATLGDLDAATAAHGLATPTGINSTTGIAGLVLGGGFGWLSRKYGMTIDNLVSADVVTADGSELHASEDENSDLFWALRGGGANFGVVTQFEFRLHQVGPDLLSGLIVLPQSQAKEALKKYAAFTKTMPEELNVWAVLRKAPPLPFLPEDIHGTDGIIFAICWIVAAISILMNGTYPDWAANFIRGYLRWTARLMVYMASLVDEYPPFSFDADEQAALPESPSSPPASTEPPTAEPADSDA